MIVNGAGLVGAGMKDGSRKEATVSERLDHRFSHKWHVAINQFHEGKIGSPEWRSWLYEAKTMADEVPRMTMLFRRERDGLLTTTHTQCSRSESVPVIDNHLSCCLGVACRACPELLALDTIKEATPEQIDQAKAWTCAAHIVSNGGDHAGEGYLLTVDDRRYWNRVYQNMAASDPAEASHD